MAVARTIGVTLLGVHGQLVEIEADLSQGIPGLSFTGLADTAVVESRDRIRAAIANSHADWPNRRLTVALLPADVPKAGSRFDLGLAVAVLAASGQVPAEAVREVLWLAELGLDGRIRPVRGVLPAVLAAVRHGVGRAVVAAENAPEAALAGDLDVRCASSLREVIDWLTGAAAPLPQAAPPVKSGHRAASALDLADIAGQALPKRALEIAAAGGHNLYLVGAPGAGKTMLAERLAGLLPRLDHDTAVEVTAVHSVAGRLDAGAGLVGEPPFEAPHHTASRAALVGGGSGLGRPGAVSLAHGGALFLDEAPEFSPSVLDALRQPLENGTVVLHRSGGVVRYPARFQLILAANPCPCGARPSECVCSPHTRRRYRQRLSGPLLDRVDPRVEVEPVAHADLFDPGVDPPAETSATVAERVRGARVAAAERWAAAGWRSNAAAPGPELRSGRWALPRGVVAPAEDFVARGTLSARGFDRVLRLAWTIADLHGHSVPCAADVNEALFLRVGSSAAWAA